MKLFNSQTRWIGCVVAFMGCCVLGNIVAPAFYYLAFAVCLLEITVCHLRDNFYFSIFLIANLRILDDTGVTVLVNVCMVLPLIKYMLFCRLRTDVFCLTLLFFLLEVIHIAVFEAWNTFLPLICWLLAFMYAFSALLNKQLAIDSQKSGQALALGVLGSAFVYLICNTKYTYNIIEMMSMGYRLDGYAGDPNYYSLYLCLAMAMLLSTKRQSRLNWLYVVLLMGLGFLTASKMCFLMMSFIIGYAVIIQFMKRDERGEVIRRTVFISMVVLAILWKYVLEFFNNLLLRGGLDTAFISSLSMHQLTTGRSTIVHNYLSILITQLPVLLFGAGMSYHHYLNEASHAEAHNTYLDIILAWGWVGAILMVVTGIYLFRIYHRQHFVPITLSNILPLLTVLLNFFDLSCFNAVMFWFVLVIALNGISTCDESFIAVCER